jgi:hypothetical protein
MKQKTWIPIVIIIVVIIAGFLILRKKPAEAPTEIPVAINNVVTGIITVQPEMISVAENSYLLGIEGTYPKFPQADFIFNKKIAEFITSGIIDFKQEANDNYQARLETGGDEFQKQFANGGQFTYQIKTEIIQSNEYYISVLIHIAGFSGGAHGYETTTSFNYDVKNKSEITLASLFLNDKNYLKTISDSARTQLTEKLTKASEQVILDENMQSMLNDGTDPAKPENFQTFSFTPDVVTIYFGQYQVAPYVYGEQSIDILRK